MLDEKSEAVLTAVNGLCADGGFKIIEERELLRLLPAETENVGRILSFLEEKRFIELRYAEEGTYCVRTMPAGRSYAERTAYEKTERGRSRRETLLCAALGAMLGGAAVSLIALLVGLFLRV